MLTTQQIADEFSVAYQTVMAWIYKGKFPNAQKEETPRGIYYLVPRSDLRDFKPGKRGRPKGGKKAATGQTSQDEASASDAEPTTRAASTRSGTKAEKRTRAAKNAGKNGKASKKGGAAK